MGKGENELDLGVLHQDLMLEAEKERSELSHEILSYLFIRAPLEDRISLVANGKISFTAFHHKERELIKLWLEMFSQNAKVHFLDLKNQVTLRKLDLDVDELTAGNFTVSNLADCELALDNLSGLNAKLGTLKLFGESVESMAAGEPVTPDLLLSLEKVFSEAGTEHAKSPDEVHQALQALRAEELNASDFFIKTGYQTFDVTFGGLRRKELSIICGRPGGGKTMLAINIAVQAMRARPDLKVAFFSLEMPEQDVLRRMLVCNDNLYQPKLGAYQVQPQTIGFADLGKDGVIAQQLFDSASSKLVTLLGTRFRIIDDDPMTIDQIEAKIMQMCLTNKPDLVIIDYWQMIGGGKGQNLRERLVNVSQRLKSLAKRYGITILVLAQLRRQQANGDEIIHPDLSSIAESDQIGRDAALVACVSSMKADDGAGGKYTFTGVDVVKNRHGKTGLIEMDMAGGVGRFYEVGLVDDWPKPYRDKSNGAKPITPIGGTVTFYGKGKY